MIKFNNIKIADIGFYINLDKRKDRKEKIESQLNEFNISGVERFSAFDEYDANTLNCKRSHLMLMKKLLDSDFDTLLILEDDCLFLDVLKKDGEKIFQDINNTDWDLFWLGCKNRKNIVKYKNNCFQVSSTSYAQSYLIKRNMCEFIINNFYDNNFYCQPVTPDELLTLSPYGIDVVLHPEKYNFYNLDSPLNTLPTHFKHLCYKYPLTTQYSSYSDLWHREVNYEDYIQIKYPI
jgi:GR25 family glycosyltransferase involved in LPS biosynthesis